ncbi:MAG: polysaccharide biosynthesis C-terminal domain-containing protein [Lactobacillus sp.]|uniref:oligosaccharide flippase family protein n=1 Tax=Bombilactobacillus bombi TaxID=1303590 RepID=UPI0035EF1DE4|nr:polysaccharide biosynthesis C-terminal domain-containing protein [Lactobacillus sp.]
MSKIAKDYMYNSLYQIFVLLVPIVTIPYISRVLGPYNIGVNSYTNSVVQYFILIGGIGVTNYGNRQIAYCRGDKEKISRNFWEIFFLRCITLFISLMFFYIIIFGFSNKYFKEYVAQSILIISTAFDISWFYMGLEDFKTTVLRNLIIKIVTLFCVFYFVKSRSDLLLYILILSISQLLGNLSLFPKLLKLISKPDFNNLNILRHLGPSSKLVISELAIPFYVIINKTMLGKLDSMEASGFYDNSDKIIKMVLAIVTATGTVMLPRVAKTFAQGNMKKVKSYLYNSFNFVSFISIPMMYGVAAISPKFVPMFFGNNFSGIIPLIMIESTLILVIGWGNVFGAQYLIPVNKVSIYTKAILLGALTNLILGFPMIYKFGTIGAMIVTVLSEITVTGYELYSIRNDICLNLLFKDIWKYFVSGLVMFLVVLILNINLKFNILIMAIEILFGSFIYFFILWFLKPRILKKLF